MIERELSQQNNLIVKKRAIELLVRLSDFQELQDNTDAQKNLAQGVLRVFASDDNDNADLCLKMSCIEYMRNFFNDHQFRVNTYAHIVPDVVRMGSTMLQRCSDNSKAVNQILDLYRFIVDKYAAMTLPMPALDVTQQASTVNEFLISMLRDAWTHFIRLMSGGNDPVTSLDDIDFDEVYGEESIILNTIVRILNYIVVVSPHTRLIHFCFRLAAIASCHFDSSSLGS